MATIKFNSYLQEKTHNHYKDQLVGLMSWQPENSVPSKKKTQSIMNTMLNWMV
jgi:hypothetical protein